MTNMFEFDADGARKVEAVYTTADVIRQRDVVLSAIDIKPGNHVLDVGVGPGFLAAELAAAVGSGGRVCGIDISDDMLAIAPGGRFDLARLSRIEPRQRHGDPLRR